MIGTTRECWATATTSCGHAKICGLEYDAATFVMQRIDDFAGVLPGNWEMFWQ